MTWTLLLALVLAPGLLLLGILLRRAELLRMREALRERERAERAGAEEARLLEPVVDLSRCLGCGACIRACPEEGVIALVHGQAMVVNGARCVGHAACERECPVGAVTVTVRNLAERRDLPAVDASLEAIGSPGLFLAGEVTGRSLIRNALDQGANVAREVARRVRAPAHATAGSAAGPGHEDEETPLDLCIVGAGPAGLACALEARRAGLRYALLEQEGTLGGTVAKYPRRKLVMTERVEIPGHGALERRTYEKEELVALWGGIAAEAGLEIRTGTVFQGLARGADGAFEVRTGGGTVRAAHVCLAIGRRGVPRRLGVPGEDLPKVAYSLLDARSFEGRRLLVVGGGNSAVEAAIALAGQAGAEVTLSYRRTELVRASTRNRERLAALVAEGRVRLLLGSEVRSIEPSRATLELREGDRTNRLVLANDEVFVMAGGLPPVDLLGRSGVSFDPGLRPAVPAPAERGPGLARALAAAFLFAAAALVFALLHRDYYALPAAERPTHPKHDLLRPGRGLGLALGAAAAALVLANLAYLARRAGRLGLRAGSLRAWMTVHVATGMLALLCALLHGAMAPAPTPGGHALLALAVLAATGAIGRYLYAWVPRAANGNELALADAKAALAAVSREWSRGYRRFRETAREEVEALVDARQWRGGFAGRLLGFLLGQRALKRVLRRIRLAGRLEQVDAQEVEETVALARRAHRAAVGAAHYEDLRALLGGWRWLHRWLALFLLLLVALHVLHAFLYGFEGREFP